MSSRNIQFLTLYHTKYTLFNYYIARNIHSNPKISDISKMLYNGTMLNDNEYTEVEGRKYLNPNLVVGETSSFIDNLRQTQNAQNTQIVADTQALGTNVPSNLGGLTGGEGYWTSRYQTPQTNTLVQDLRTAAQASALNQALQNEQEIWKKRYQDAYRRYQKSAYDRANQPSTTGGGAQGRVDYEDTTADIYSGRSSMNITYGDETQAGGTNRVSIVEPGSGYTYTWEYPIGSMDVTQRKLINTDDPNYYRGTDGFMYRGEAQQNRTLNITTPLGTQANLGAGTLLRR